MKSYQIVFVVFTLIPWNIFAQSSFEFGVLPSININKKLPRDWSVNFKTESRQSLIKEAFNYEYLLTDISLLTVKKTGINTSVAMGYLLRIEDGGIKNRTIQQINFLSRRSNFRLAHRVVADQTFQENTPTEFRLRYRLSTEIPLSGQSLDPKEFFLKMSNEYLHSLEGGDYDLEIRGLGFVGYVISPKNKLELGIDYRIDSFIKYNPRHRFWMGLNFYQSI